jgi:hypothetical protein
LIGANAVQGCGSYQRFFMEEEGMERILENAVIYFSLVFRPQVLVRIAREYLQAADMLKGVNKDVRQLRTTLQTTPCKQDK